MKEMRKRETGEEVRKIDEEREGEKEREGFSVSIEQLSRLGMSIPKLWTIYFVQSNVVV